MIYHNGRRHVQQKQASVANYNIILDTIITLQATINTFISHLSILVKDFLKMKTENQTSN